MRYVPENMRDQLELTVPTPSMVFCLRYMANHVYAGLQDGRVLICHRTQGEGRGDCTVESLNLVSLLIRTESYSPEYFNVY